MAGVRNTKLSCTPWRVIPLPVRVPASSGSTSLDGDLPDHDAAAMDRLFPRPMPDWSDRTPGTQPAPQVANQLGMVFARPDCNLRWRERLPELAAQALVVHGRR